MSTPAMPPMDTTVRTYTIRTFTDAVSIRASSFGEVGSMVMFWKQDSEGGEIGVVGAVPLASIVAITVD